MRPLASIARIARFGMPRASRPLIARVRTVSVSVGGGDRLPMRVGHGGLARAEERGADLDARRAEREGGRDAAAVGDPAGGDDRRTHGVDHLRDEREGADERALGGAAGTTPGARRPRRRSRRSASTPASSSATASATVVAVPMTGCPRSCARSITSGDGTPKTTLSDGGRGIHDGVELVVDVGEECRRAAAAATRRPPS